jgi:hypothetical protein
MQFQASQCQIMVSLKKMPKYTDPPNVIVAVLCVLSITEEANVVHVHVRASYTTGDRWEGKHQSKWAAYRQTLQACVQARQNLKNWVGGWEGNYCIHMYIK